MPIFPFFSCHFKGIHMLLYHTFNKSLVGASLRNFTQRCGELLCLAHFFHIHKFIITVQILFKSSGTLSHTHTLVSELTSGGCSNFSKSTLFFCSAESLAIVLSKDRATCWKEKAEIQDPMSTVGTSWDFLHSFILHKKFSFLMHVVTNS